VIASWRAELLVLRKSRIAWVIIAVPPLTVLVSTYLFSYLDYALLTPAEYAQFGTPAQELPAMLPSQFVIQTVTALSQTLPFMLLGALMAGADWGSGTIRTAMLQGPSRTSTFAGQVLAIMTVSTGSVLACFAISGVSSVVIGVLTHQAAVRLSATVPAPGLRIVGEAIGAGILVGLSYTALGIALGTLCRSATGGVAAAFAWYTIVEQFLFDLSTDTGGWLVKVYDGFPGSSTVTLTSMFGSPGGGADSATYQPVRPWTGVAVLCGYTVVWLGLAWIVTVRRNIVGAHTLPTWAPARRRHRPRRRPILRLPAALQNRGAGTALPGVRASLRAELTVLARWPAMWALVLVYPLQTLLWSYFSNYILYLNAAHGAMTLLTPYQILPTLLPGQFVMTALNGFWNGNALPGSVACALIGAMAAGSSWANGTIRTAAMQAPSRARTVFGQALAVATASVTSVALTFAVAGAASALLALRLTGGLTPVRGPFPSAAHIVGALALAAVIGVAWTAVGWTVATALRSATAAFALILVWSTIVQFQLDSFSTELSGPIRTLYELLPDASSDTISNLFGQVTVYGPVFEFAKLAPVLAVAVLVAYAAGGFTLPVFLTSRRNLT